MLNWVKNLNLAIGSRGQVSIEVSTLSSLPTFQCASYKKRKQLFRKKMVPAMRPLKAVYTFQLYSRPIPQHPSMPVTVPFSRYLIWHYLVLIVVIVGWHPSIEAKKTPRERILRRMWMNPEEKKNTILVLEAKEAKTAKFVSIRSDGNVPAKHPIRTLRVLAGKFFLL